MLTTPEQPEQPRSRPQAAGPTVYSDHVDAAPRHVARLPAHLHAGARARAGLLLILLVALLALWMIPSRDYIFLPDRAHPVAPLVTSPAATTRTTAAASTSST